VTSVRQIGGVYVPRDAAVNARFHAAVYPFNYLGRMYLDVSFSSVPIIVRRLCSWRRDRHLRVSLQL